MRGISRQLDANSARDSRGYDKVTIDYIKQANPHQPTENDLFKNYYSLPISSPDVKNSTEAAANRQYNSSNNKKYKLLQKSSTKIKPSLSKPSGLPPSYHCLTAR